MNTLIGAVIGGILVLILGKVMTGEKSIADTIKRYGSSDLKRRIIEAWLNRH